MSNLKGLPKNTLKYAAGYSPDDIRTRVVKSFLDILILIVSIMMIDFHEQMALFSQKFLTL